MFEVGFSNYVEIPFDLPINDFIGNNVLQSAEYARFTGRRWLRNFLGDYYFLFDPSFIFCAFSSVCCI